MPREYKRIKHLLKEILLEKEKGSTHQEIGEMYGFSRKQVSKLVERHRQNQKKLIQPQMPAKRRGRPRTTPITTQREQEHEINKLKMENKLLRDFLQECGRR